MATKDLIKQLEIERDAIAPRIEMLRDELAVLEQEHRRLERAVKVLKGEPLGNPSKGHTTRGPYGKGVDVGIDKKGKRRSISEAKVNQVQAEIMKLAQDTDGFRQVDVRGRIQGINSSSAALAFEVLRQRGVIRLARQDGLNKYYRLTPAVANKNGNDKELSNASST